ncbi:PEPxxWA-CTERM sorting domain-containing protein [Phenylobacterium sp. LjRoot164]|uniref:PEPxxWA-CTERM sorting domain-containing protein n=1 Tax=unclassified Phenylobacterium TaxID=2640670 RepID=UPI003ED0460E
MIRKLLVAAAAAASLFAGSSAMAAQIVTTNDNYFEEGSGLAYPYTSFLAPDAGMQAFVKIFFDGGSLRPDSMLQTTRDVTYSYWDAGIGMVNGNEYAFEQVCSVANGCIQIKGPGYAVAKLMTPRNWTKKECTAATSGYCSELYWDNALTYFEGIFISDGSSDRMRVSIQVSDFTAVPEPATWAMMIVGFGLAGTALRRRQAAYS